MTWAKFDDKMLDHPKIDAAGPLAVAIYHRAILYCSKYLTDGRLHERALRKLVDWEDDAADFPDRLPNNLALAARLVDAGLFDKHPDGGWVVHDYLDYNPSRESFTALRKARSDAGRIGGRTSRRKRGAIKGGREASESKQAIKQVLKQVLGAGRVPKGQNELLARKDCDTAENESKQVLKQVLTGCLPEKIHNQKHVNSNGTNVPKDQNELLARKDCDTAENGAEKVSKCLSKCSSKTSSKSRSRTRTPYVIRDMYIPADSGGAAPAAEPPSSDRPATSTAADRCQPASGQVAVCSILLRSGAVHEVAAPEAVRLQDAYPSVDVRGELARMAEWCSSNPTRRKTPRGIRRFISSWCQRAQQDASQGVVGRRVNGHGKANFADVTHDLLEGWANEGD